MPEQHVKRRQDEKREHGRGNNPADGDGRKRTPDLGTGPSRIRTKEVASVVKMTPSPLRPVHATTAIRSQIAPTWSGRQAICNCRK